MHRKISIIFLTAALISGCMSCQSAADTTTETQTTDSIETETETETTSIMDELGTKDFEGRTYTIFENDYTDFHVNIPEDTLTGDVINDALYQRDVDIEDRYNVVLEYHEDDSSEPFKNSVLAGDDLYNIIISDNMNSLVNSGVLTNLCALDNLSLDQSWWSPLIYDSIRYDDRMYFTTGDISPAVYQSPFCMFLNLALYEELGIETDIWDLVIDGKWTLDSVIELTKGLDRDLNNDDQMDLKNDFYGIVMQPTEETTDALLAGCGEQLSGILPDGSGLGVTFNERTVSVVEKMMQFTQKIVHEDINDVINYTFKEGRALFLQHKLESAGVHLRDMEDPYLILPMPKYDENQETYISGMSIFVHCFVGVPKTADPEFSGFITEALARYSHEKIRPLSYDLVYTQKVTRDERSLEVLNIIFDTLYVDFGMVFNFGGMNVAMKDIVFDGKPLTSTIDSLRGTTEEAIEDFLENWDS